MDWLTDEPMARLSALFLKSCGNRAWAVSFQPWGLNLDSYAIAQAVFALQDSILPG